VLIESTLKGHNKHNMESVSTKYSMFGSTTGFS